MILSPENAAEALREIELTAGRSREAQAYLKGSYFLFLWGVIWIAGYLGTALRPQAATIIWLVLDACGIIGSIAFGRLLNRPGEEAALWSRRWMGAFGAMTLFVIATYIIMKPQSGVQFATYPAVAMALVYTMIGLWLPRYLWLGATIFVSAMAGYLLFAPWIFYWIAATGGGALLLSGFWLRRA
jgi:hypothetical protein